MRFRISGLGLGLGLGMRCESALALWISGQKPVQFIRDKKFRFVFFFHINKVHIHKSN